MILAFSLGNLALFHAERLVFQREHRSRMYSLGAYFFAKILVDIPFLLLFLPVSYVSALYFAVKLRNDLTHYLTSTVVVILLANCGNAIGLWGAAIVPDFSIGIALLPLLLLPMMMFSGLFVSLKSVPAWIRWLQWLSPIKYGFTALFRNEIEGVTINCKPEVDNVLCFPRTGDQIMAAYGILDQGGVLPNTLAIGGWWIAWVLLGYITYWIGVKRMERRVVVVGRKEYEAKVFPKKKRFKIFTPAEKDGT